MSTKTAIDLDTLGMPDNDSEGIGCYISEKGIQALPSSKRAMAGLEDNGLYLCKFFMLGETCHVFEKKVVGEDGAIKEARFLRLSPASGALDLDQTSAEVPAGYFGEEGSREIKAVSYMTLTDKSLPLYMIDSNSVLTMNVMLGILAVFSCNIIAFHDEDGKKLTFVKNPVFFDSLSDEVSDLSPLQVYIYRAFIPSHKITSRSAEVSGKYDASNGHNDALLLLHEESIFLYDKESRKIKALYQRRRRLAGDGYEGGSGNVPTLTFNGNRVRKNHIYLIKEPLPNNPNQYNNAHLYYVHAFYTFEHSPAVKNATFRVQFEKKWEQGNIFAAYVNQSIAGWEPSDEILYIYHGFPECVYMPDSEAFFCLRPGDGHTSDPFYINPDVPAGIAKGNVVAEWSAADYMKVGKGTTIDRVLEYVNAHPLRWLDSGDDRDESTLAGPGHYWHFIAQEYKEPELWANIGQRHSQKCLHAQRSRAFSLGTKVLGNLWPFISETMAGANTEEITLKKFKAAQTNGNQKEKALDVRIDENAMGNFGDLSAIESDFHEGSRIIYALFAWPSEDKTVEYENAVYHTRVGSFGIAFADSPYFVPSNVSDVIEGLYGEDRNIWAISHKSIEEFNIADIDVSPVQFVRLARTYDMLADWTGINGRLDTITKELGEFMLNGTPRIKKIFSMQSKIMPATMIKGTRMDAIDCGDCIRLVDGQGREFKAEKQAAALSVTLKEKENIFADSTGTVWETNLDEGNHAMFRVEWTYRTGRNILLSKVRARTAQHGAMHGEQKRIFRLFREGVLIRERATSEQTVDFFKIGRGLNSRLAIETEGYLREVEIEDTERGQK